MSPKSKRAALLLAGATAAATGVAWAGGVFGSSDALAPEAASAAVLEPFDSCEELLAYAQAHRWARNLYYGTPMPLGGVVLADAAMRTSASGAEQAAAEAVGPSETGTNVQEAGIDEPDLAKLAGETLFVLARDRLESFDVSGDAPEPLGTIELTGNGRYGYAAPQLLLAGDRALVITQHSERPDWTPRTRLEEVDVSDPGSMSVLRTMDIDGSYLSARLRGDTAHLVLASVADFPRPVDDADRRDDRDDEPETGTTGKTGPVDPPEDTPDPGWLPQATLHDAVSGETTTQALFGCDAVSFPDDFAGLGLLSILTIDMAAGLPAADTDVVMTNGQTVYASASSLYVATEAVPRPGPDLLAEIGRAVAPSTAVAPAEFPGHTLIHRFDTGDPLATDYAGSGEVRGRLLSQFSMSEHEGHLRVAATEGDTWAEGANESESAVTVLAIGDGALDEVGRVSGLGRGESIYAVRFFGDVGYVVTFEQTDPLYTIDLSTPSDPRTAGELKIPGYSAYLHPVGDGLLLGIGQDGTNDGQVTGAQASLFDVGDLSDPDRVAQVDLAGGDRWGSSATEWDHHAFLYAPAERLAIVPVTSYGRASFSGAVAMEVDPAGRLTELARFEDGRGATQRMLVVGERLVTVSPAGVTLRDLDGFAETGSAPLAR